MKPPTVNIIEIAISDIVSYAGNANTHPPSQIARLTKSIKEFGFLVPCVVKTRESGKYDLAAGHGRIVAAKRAGLKKVPAVVADHLTAKQFRAYVVADNKLAEMSVWDADILKAELGEILLDGFDADVLGFDQDEADKILGLCAQDEESGGSASHDDSEGEGDGGSSEKGMKTTIAYNVIFDTDEQQQAFFGFIRYLKANVDGESIGARLRVFITEGGYTRE